MPYISYSICYNVLPRVSGNVLNKTSAVATIKTIYSVYATHYTFSSSGKTRTTIILQIQLPQKHIEFSISLAYDGKISPTNTKYAGPTPAANPRIYIIADGANHANG